MADVNKVEFGGRTLIDLTADTVDENSVLENETFHAADGSIRSGVVPKRKITDTVKADFNRVVDEAADGDLIIVEDEEVQPGGGGETIYKGTTEEINAQLADIPEEAVVIITDDYDGDNSATTWTGTKAEYEALDRSNWKDGMIVNITDDYTEKTCNTIQDCIDSTNPNDIAGASVINEMVSNMKATSHPMPTILNGTLNFGTVSVRNGICCFSISIKNTSTAVGEVQYLSGLPKPIAQSELIVAYDTPGQFQRGWVTTNGDAMVWLNPRKSGLNIVMSGTYLIADE